MRDHDIRQFDKEDYTNAAIESAQEIALIRTAFIHQTNKDKGIEGYGAQALDIVAKCNNAGIPEACNAISMCGKSKRSTIAMQLFAEVDDTTKRIKHAGFKAHGCIAMIACASIAASIIVDKTLDEALDISMEDIKKQVGQIPDSKAFTPYIAYEAIRACVGDYYLRNGHSSNEVKQAVSCHSGQMACWVCEDCSLRNSLLAEIAQQEVKEKDYSGAVHTTV